MIAAVELGFGSLLFQNKNCDAVFKDHVTLLMVNSLSLSLSQSAWQTVPLWLWRLDFQPEGRPTFLRSWRAT